MKTSNLYTLDWQDAAKGVLVAVGGAAIAAIEAGLNTGSLTVNWQQISITALTAGLAYLAKNFFTPSKIVRNAEVK